MAETRDRQAPARVAPVDEWLTGVREAAEPRTEIFRTRRGRAWDPGAIAPIVPQEQRAADRQAEFTRLREEEGLKVGAAAKMVGVTHQTGSKYEALRKARLAGSDPAAGAL